MENKPASKNQAYRKAGHRSWAARSAPVKGEHIGDIMSVETRSQLMSRIPGKNTKPEKIIFARLNQRHVYFAKHVKTLPGKPDIVFRRARLAVFIDGDFWHGWRFPLWQHKLSDEWNKKIAANRSRDQRNFRELRRIGWKVLRIWEHQIEKSPDACVELILRTREECLARLMSNQPR